MVSTEKGNENSKANIEEAEAVVRKQTANCAVLMILHKFSGIHDFKTFSCVLGYF